MNEFFFDSDEEVITALSLRLEKIGKEIIDDPILTKSALIALPGGKTPIPLYQRMSQSAVAWHLINLCPTDERDVTPDDPHRNDVMIKNSLLSDHEMHKFISLDQLEEHNDLKLHTILLGMGEDGHIASLFPPFYPPQGHGKIVKGSAPQPPHDRHSLSFHMILSAKNILLFFLGPAKKKIFMQAKKGITTTLPVSYLIDFAGDKLEVYSA